MFFITLPSLALLGFGLFLVIFASAILLFFKSIYLVRQAEAIVIERLGCYDRTLFAGLHIIIPFIQKPRAVYWSFVRPIDDKRYHRFHEVIDRIDLRESVHDFPKQNVITKDNVTIEINALLYYQITNPQAAVYAVANLPEAIEKLTQTTLRNVIGSMDLDETLVSRDLINTRLREILDEASEKWGVHVNRVELQEVNPPIDIKHAMEKQMRAERDRRAIILESEGKKKAAILEAEGIQEARVLTAQGEAQAEIIRANGQAQARSKIVEAEAHVIRLIKESIPQADPLPYLIALEYMKTLPQMMAGKDNKTILVPYEASSLMGSLASMQQLFQAQNTQK